MGFTKVPIFIIGGLIGIIIVYFCLVKPLIGFYIVASLSYFIAYPGRVLKMEIPLSTGIEVLMLVLLLGTVSIRKREGHSSFYKSPATIAFFIYLLFILIELFNPNMYSIGGWIFYLRRFVMFIFIYIVTYRLLDDLNKIKLFLKLWIYLAVIAGGYACIQQWFGLLPFEMDYLMSDPHLYKLYFQGGSIRKFSFLSDPPTFGILAGSTAVLVLILAINEKVSKKRNLYYFLFVVLMLGMAYSGTRTTNIMLPAGLCLYALLTITDKKTLITVFVCMIGLAFLMFGPIQNNTINRMRSTFDSENESVEVRDNNRKYIQPYIYSHPIGGGIATAGVLGEKYNPGHPLAGFPPDSGLLLAAIELGWIGYSITFLVYFLLLYQGVHFYFLTRSKENRILIAAITVSIFPIIIAQYSQVTIGQLPNAFFFYSSFAIVFRLKELGKELF